MKHSILFRITHFPFVDLHMCWCDSWRLIHDANWTMECRQTRGHFNIAGRINRRFVAQTGEISSAWELTSDSIETADCHFLFLIRFFQKLSILIFNWYRTFGPEMTKIRRTFGQTAGQVRRTGEFRHDWAWGYQICCRAIKVQQTCARRAISFSPNNIMNIM